MPRAPNSGEFLQWWLISEALSSRESSSQKRCMALLLKTILHVPQETFARRMRGIYNSDPVAGAEACSWGMRVMSWTAPPGKDRDFFLDQMSRADRDAATMRRLKSGWEQYGMPPMDVVNHRPAPQIPRYNSEPIFRSTRSETVGFSPPLPGRC